MRLLILGGTAWLGGHLVKTAQAGGHEVTCLARGTSGPVPNDVELVRADRTLANAYDEVVNRRWDSAIDLSRQPGQVRSATSALAKSCNTFIFVSSTNVYAHHGEVGQDESAALLPPLHSDILESIDLYGQAKVACEQSVFHHVGATHSLIVRVGLIGGPGDEFDRTGYWPLRFATAAQSSRSVLIPATPKLATQVIDVRDLARWIIDSACNGLVGTFNATGETQYFEEHIETARRVGAHTGPVISADSEWLLQQGVTPWMGRRSLPLWLPASDYAGFSARDSSAAAKAGLTRRPLESTLRDTLEWERSRDPQAFTRRAGLSDAEESSLIAALAERDA